MIRKIFIKELMVIFIGIIIISCDFGYSMKIVNHTTDTILIGSANYNTIDSIQYFIMPDVCWEQDSIRVYVDALQNPEKRFGNINELEKIKTIYVYPDSTATERSFNCKLFAQNNDKKGYFFIIKLDVARRHTWNEIRDNRLYDRLIVTREMLKSTNVVHYPIKRE